MNTLVRLWLDESGAIATTDLALICTILVIGLIVGLTTMRDQIVQEMGDVAVGIASLNQSFSFAGATLTIDGEEFVVAGSAFEDGADDCDDGCISVSAAAQHESQ